MKVREKLGNGADNMKTSWTSNKVLRGVGQSARVLDVLDLGMEVTKAKHPTASEEYLEKELWADVSQCGSRMPYALSCLRGLTTSSQFFSYRHRRALVPVEVLRLLGFPNPNIEELSPSQVRDLAGEAMPLAPVALILGCLTSSLPGFWEQH